jgi:hypothetical protein
LYRFELTMEKESKKNQSKKNEKKKIKIID